MEQLPVIPIERIRARFLLSWLIVAFILSFVLVAGAWSDWLANPDPKDPLPDAVGGILASGLIFAGTALRARRVGLAIGDLYSDFPPRDLVARLAALALPLVGVAFVGIYLVYAPLSLIFPDATQSWLFEELPVVYSASRPYPVLGNALSCVSIAVAAPIAEEWLFRGLLLRRWAHKWGTRPGVIASSLVFAVLHVDVLGGFVFGVVMCALYARYQSLWAPTIAHAANNALAWGFAVLDAHGAIPIELISVTQLRAAWWLPVLGLLLVLPWALRVRGARDPISSWTFGGAPR